jgi:uncharacterized protein
VRRTDLESRILLGSGAYFSYSDPHSAEVTIEDIAYGLAFAGRFAGQCVSQETGKRVFYSVAEHCVRMSFVVPPTLALHALMHEAGESTCGDMPGPLKALCPDFKKIEKHCEAALLQKFEVVVRDDEQIKHFDRVMLATERRDLMPWRGELWGDIDELAPLQEEISPWPPETAAERFLARYRELSGNADS